MTREILIDAMEAAGYWFDSFESYENAELIRTEGLHTWLVFRGDDCYTMYFDSWEEVEEWLRCVMFDDPDVYDRVENILRRAG